MADNEFDSSDPDFIAHTEHHAREWAAWMEHDLEHFVQILRDRTGASTDTVLLYLISERLGQIADQGIRITVRHEVPKPPPGEGDEWKAD